MGRALTVLATQILKTSGWLHCQSKVFLLLPQTQSLENVLSWSFLFEFFSSPLCLLFIRSTIFFWHSFYLLAGSIRIYLGMKCNVLLVFEGIIQITYILWNHRRICQCTIIILYKLAETDLLSLKFIRLGFIPPLNLTAAPFIQEMFLWVLGGQDGRLIVYFLFTVCIKFSWRTKVIFI